MISDWKNYPVPVGVVIVGAMAWLYISTNYVEASEYKKYQHQQYEQIEGLRIDQLIMQRDALAGQLFDLQYRLRGVEDPQPEDLRRLESLEQAIEDIEDKIADIREQEFEYELEE